MIMMAMQAAMAVALLAQAPCAQAVDALTAAQARAWVLDVSGAAAALEAAGLEECRATRVAAVYLRGLDAARAAAARGGDDPSLQPVRRAAERLQSLADPTAALAALGLRAAMAAAQSERGEMALYLEQGLADEAVRMAAGEPGAPVIPVHELAAELWLQVHWYDEARVAFGLARARTGDTPRVALGLARAGVRLDDVRAACTEYRHLLALWKGRTDAPTREVGEARAYARRGVCGRAAAR